jgi:hypothetical protein
MPSHADSIRLLLAQGPASAAQLVEKIGISQPTLSRAISAMGQDVLRIPIQKSIRYALRDFQRGIKETQVYRVSAEGAIRSLGRLVPVRPEGYVMCQDDGVCLHSEGLPWWLADMRPQGFLGRAYAARHAQTLGLPDKVSQWSDTHALHALVMHGHDALGNLLLGDAARDHFLNLEAPQPVALSEKGESYGRLAREAIRGDRPGSSAGGEQPKFTVLAETAGGLRHLLVKFTLPDDNAITERWRDLLLAEHHALECLAAWDVLAAHSTVFDHAGQRFLEVERFDRTGALGRRGLFSLAALEAHFVGDASAAWPVLAQRLATDGHVTAESAATAALLYAFGTLIGNTDMHHGNLSFISEQGRPYSLAPAYDMLPMGFAPNREGGMPSTLGPVTFHPGVSNEIWHRALELASDFLARIRSDGRFSVAFAGCIGAMSERVALAREKSLRLG